jgi:hypothetical protein
VFEPNSLRVRRKHNGGNKWVGVLESYKLTEAMQNINISFGNKIQTAL